MKSDPGNYEERIQGLQGHTGTTVGYRGIQVLEGDTGATWGYMGVYGIQGYITYMGYRGIRDTGIHNHILAKGRYRGIQGYIYGLQGDVWIQ